MEPIEKQVFNPNPNSKKPILFSEVGKIETSIIKNWDFIYSILWRVD